jgi:chitinase
MSYDLHGNWDANNAIGNQVFSASGNFGRLRLISRQQVLAHTNLTEIDDALTLFWRNSVNPNKIVMGLGFYGRSFKLSNKSCTKVGCPFIPLDQGGGADPGNCTQNCGTLSYKEIMGVVNFRAGRPIIDSAAAVNVLVFNGDQWVS